MSTPTSGELTLLRTQPHQTKLYLSIFEPQTLFTAQVNDSGIAKGDRVITYDNSSGDRFDITGGMTMYVGTTAGGKEKGEIWVRDTPTTTQITVGENSHIDWEDDDYLTIVNFYQIWPLYPRYVQDGEDITVYKVYDRIYTDQNEYLGSFLVMGSHYAGFMTTGTAQVYWDASESENVMNTTGSTYQWYFEGGTPTGSASITPGWVTYDTPGHYRTFLKVTEPLGSNEDFGFRQVSIYERPEDGTNNPILAWGLDSFTGSRDEGGYSARIWVKENVPSVVDGALVIIFADDWYGTTKQSIGGNASNRENIVFVGYILDGSIDYDYETSTVYFDAGSPTEVMKIGEAFSVSVEDSNNPTASAADKGGDPWFYLKGLSVKTALYHYYRWHSTVISLMDIRFLATDFDIQYFDADRTSLYDAANTFLQSSIYGSAVCDRQGALFFETKFGAINNAESSLDNIFFIDRHDWMGAPSISERRTNEVSYFEAGGVAYSGGGSGTWSALLSAAPGVTPAYRGKNIKVSGMALSSQGQLNTLVGNIWEQLNSTYPEISLDLVGNYRHIDIAPQEIVTMTLNAEDTFRGLSWEQKAFVPTAMSWDYNSEDNLLLPSVTLSEVTQGNAGQTIAIPVAPPDDGFKQPPLQLPPPIPPIPVPPLDFSIGLGFVFVPALGGYDGTNAQTWANGTIPGTTIQGINIETDSTAVGAAWGVPLGVTSLYAYPVIANNGIEQTIQIYFTLKGYYLGSASADVSDTTNSSILFTAGDLIWCTDLALTIDVEPGTIASFTTYPNADNDDLALWGWLCVLT